MDWITRDVSILGFYLSFGFALLRCFLSSTPGFGTGYVHPDEYFQSLEVVLGDVYQIKRSKIWEFDDENPIRNAFIPYFLYGIPCYLVKLLRESIQMYGPVSPYALVNPPRVIICVLSFLVDFALIKICLMYKTDFVGRWLMLNTSCVMLVFAFRTFSNTVEMILFSLLLYVVSKNIIESEKAYPIEEKLRASLEESTHPRDRVLILRKLRKFVHRNHSGFWQISLLTVLGFFNRPTFLAFAVGPIFFWLYRGAPLRKISLKTVHIRLSCLLSVGIPVGVALIICDTIYYKGDKAADMLNYGLGQCFSRISECLEITPLNFLRYNSRTDNLAKHGLHPRYLHLLVNIPILYNILGISMLFMIASIFLKVLRRRPSKLPKFDSITGLMFVSIIIPLAVLSLAPHQEPRFLIPLTLPLIFLKGMKINNQPEDTNLCGSRFSKIMIFIWCLGNAAVVFFYTFTHQAGILPAMEHITRARSTLQDEARIHVIPSYTYTLPSTLLRATVYDQKIWRSTRSGVMLYPTSSSNFHTSMKLLEAVIQSVEHLPPYNDWVYYLFPTSLTSNFTSHPILKRLKVKYVLDYYYQWHISTEALPEPAEMWRKMGLNVVLIRSEKFAYSRSKFSGYFTPHDNPSFDELFRNIS